MSEKYRLVYDFENSQLSSGDGSGGPSIMPLQGLKMIAAVAIDAALVDDRCHCSTCGLLRLARDALRSELGIRQTGGERPQLLDKRKMC